MYASAQPHPVSYAALFRSCGRIGGVIVMASWIVLAGYELYRTGAPAPEAYSQAVAVAIVFAGYVIGWQKEMFGGALAVAGTVLFYLAHVAVFRMPPSPSVALLALPGFFYMLARYLDEHNLRKVMDSNEH